MYLCTKRERERQRVKQRERVSNLVDLVLGEFRLPQQPLQPVHRPAGVPRSSETAPT